MSQAGERLLRSAEQALAYAEGRAEPGSFRVHTRVAGLSIRGEQPSDIQRIHAIESAAFGKKAIADIVDQLRDDGELWLSHVALLDDAIGRALRVQPGYRHGWRYGSPLPRAGTNRCRACLSRAWHRRSAGSFGHRSCASRRPKLALPGGQPGLLPAFRL